MSNIGFMQNCTKHIEELYKGYMDNPKKSPTKVEKDEYLNLVYQFETMYKHNEIEDTELYEKLIKKLKSLDLTTLVDTRRKLKKSGSLRRNNV